jgi:hypothetical protein
MESEAIDATNPMKARRSSHTNMECLGGSGMVSDRKLYYHMVSKLLFILGGQEAELTVANQG